MVNIDRIKRKLPCLLCNGDTGNRQGNNVFIQERYRLQQLIRRKSERANSLINELVSVLEKIDKELAP